MENLVVNLEFFAKYHPGGRAALLNNIGNNMSGQFSGANFLDADQQSIAPGHVHSQYARMIANDIAIANLEGANEQSELRRNNQMLVVLDDSRMKVVSFI